MHELDKALTDAKNILEKSSSKDKKTGQIIEIENKLKETRNSKDSLSRNIGKVEGQIDSLLRILEKQKAARAENAGKKIELVKVESLAKEINSQIDSFFDSLDISKIKNIFQSIKSILTNFIETHKDGEDKKVSEDIETDIKNLDAEKKNYELELKNLASLEIELSEQYSIVKNEIEKEKDTNRDAEKAMFRIIAEQNEVRSKLNFFESKESNLRHTEEEFKREVQEAGMLVGVYALRYKDHLPKNNDGGPVTLEELLKEPREVQESRRREIEKLKIRLEDSGIAGSDDVIKEFKETSERDAFLMKELEDLAKSSESLKVLIKELDEKLTNEFKNGVEKINSKFGEFFGTMFGGGFASLSIVKERKKKKSDTDLSEYVEDGELKEEESEEEGLEIEVNLPRKKIKGLMMLSGGERALTSIALLFAISAVNPPPFIILDETDAALDEANSKKYGDMITDLSKYSQLILITHNRETMARAGIIYGVTMGNDGVSRLLSIQFEEAVAVAK
jgi:chromosome segregation protein